MVRETIDKMTYSAQMVGFITTSGVEEEAYTGVVAG
jgi:hypothetical protein